MMNPRGLAVSISSAAAVALSILLSSGCGKSHESSPAPRTLNAARAEFSTKLLEQEPSEDTPPPAPPTGVFDLIHYPSPTGKLAAYLTPDPMDGKKHPLVVWLAGGFSNGISDIAWDDSAPADNDQSASSYREARLATMYPSLRGGNNNPGSREGLYGEVDDVLAAVKHAASLPGVDASRIYLGGHSSGGTLALLAAEAAPRGTFRAVVSFGPVANVSDYGQDPLPFNITNAKESEVRSPVKFLADITSKTFVLEGVEGNISSLEDIRQANTNGNVSIHAVKNATHFSLLQPLNSLFAEKIAADQGEECSVVLTDREIETAMADAGNAKLLPPGDLRRSLGRSALVFYHPATSAASAMKLFRAAVEKSMPGVPLVSDLESAPEPPFIFFVEGSVPSDEFPLPDMKDLKYSARGMDARDVKSILASKKAIVAGLVTPYTALWKNTKTFNELAGSYALETGAFIQDMATREYFKHDAWKGTRIDGWGSGEIPDIRTQITVHLYPRGDDSGHLRAITLGMEKYALPDVAMEKLVSSETTPAVSLINVFCQTLTTRPDIANPKIYQLSLDALEPLSIRQNYQDGILGKGTGRGAVSVFRGTPDEGDPDNDQIALGFLDAGGTTDDEKRNAFLSAFWGSKDSIVKVEHDDEIREASAAAKVKFLALREKFTAGLPAGSRLMAKSSFTTDTGGREWMWFEVMTWDEKGTLGGLLQNEPHFISKLKAGAKVSVRADEIFDYILNLPDGTKEGNQTGILLEKKSAGK